MKTLVIGATPNSSRYAYLAVVSLKKHGHEVYPVGIKKGSIDGIEINNGRPEIPGLHTVTLYINPAHQVEWYDYILALKPKRIIFNPGTENNELEKIAQKSGIKTIEACTLVLLATDQFDDKDLKETNA